MKPIFIIGATILAAGAAYSFALVVDQREPPEGLTQQDRGLAVERIVPPARQSGETLVRKPMPAPDSDKAHDVAVLPVTPRMPSDVAQPNTQSPVAEIPTPSASEQVADLSYDNLSTQPMLNFMPSDGQGLPPARPGTSSATELTDPVAVERFERLPFIGVYR